MNATRHLTPATLIAAALAAVALVQAPAAQAAGPAAREIVQLPTVHVIAPRSVLAKPAVVVMPTVHIVAKRQPTLLAQKAARPGAL